MTDSKYGLRDKMTGRYLTGADGVAATFATAEAAQLRARDFLPWPAVVPMIEVGSVVRVHDELGRRFAPLVASGQLTDVTWVVREIGRKGVTVVLTRTATEKYKVGYVVLVSDLEVAS